MGRKVWNAEEVKDHTAGEEFVRLHLDIILPAGDLAQVKNELAAKNWAAASVILQRHTAAANRPAVKEVLDSL